MQSDWPNEDDLYEAAKRAGGWGEEAKKARARVDDYHKLLGRGEPDPEDYVADLVYVEPRQPKLDVLERGAVTSDLSWNTSNGAAIIDSRLDPIKTRAALLFYDRIELPEDNNGLFRKIDEADDLRDMGVLNRSHIEFTQNQNDRFAVREAVWAAFGQLENEMPGQWTIISGPLDGKLPLYVRPDIGFRLRLDNALLIPTADTPFENILMFREARKDELLKLRSSLRKIWSQAGAAGFDPAENTIVLSETTIALLAKATGKSF